jgi:hypothetical protein
MNSFLHPLLVWWVVLYGLSMLARYEPAGWAAMIDIDSSDEAAAIENILDQAMDAIPALVLEAITSVSS